MSDTPANQEAYPQHSNSISGMRLSLSQTGGVVLCDHWSRARSFDCRIQHCLSGRCPGNSIDNSRTRMSWFAIADEGTYMDLVLVQAASADAV